MSLISETLATPTGMRPAVASRFVVHEGHQTPLDSRSPARRGQLGLVPRSVDPVENRLGLLLISTAVEALLGVDQEA